MSGNNETDAPWIVLSVEDNVEYQASLAFSIEKMKIRNQPIVVLKAKSCQEACIIARERNDISVALVDMVMEDDSAGLRFIQYIRQTLNNTSMRMVMLTGEPGIAPRKLMVECDVDEYWNKSDLQSDKLYSILCSQTRTWAALREREHNQQVLQTAIKSAQRSILSFQQERESITAGLTHAIDRLKSLSSHGSSFAKAKANTIDSEINAIRTLLETLKSGTNSDKPQRPNALFEFGKREDFDLRTVFATLGNTLKYPCRQNNTTLVCPSKPFPLNGWVNGDHSALLSLLRETAETALDSSMAITLAIDIDSLKITEYRVHAKIAMRIDALFTSANQRDPLLAELQAYLVSQRGRLLCKRNRVRANTSAHQNTVEVVFDINFFALNKPRNIDTGVLSHHCTERVLVALSNRIENRFVIDQLAAWGVRVDTCSSNAPEHICAQLQAHNSEPALLITDENSVNEVYETCKGTCANSTLLLIGVTPEREETKHAHSTVTLIERPIQPEQLLNAVHDLQSELPDHNPSGNTPVLLLIDQAQGSRQRLKQQLESVGFTVIALANNREAIETLTSSVPINLVIISHTTLFDHDNSTFDTHGINDVPIVHLFDSESLRKLSPMTALTSIDKRIESTRLKQFIQRWLPVYTGQKGTADYAQLFNLQTTIEHNGLQYGSEVTDFFESEYLRAQALAEDLTQTVPLTNQYTQTLTGLSLLSDTIYSPAISKLIHTINRLPQDESSHFVIRRLTKRLQDNLHELLVVLERQLSTTRASKNKDE